LKILVLSPIFPHAPVDGDRMRLWHWLRLLAGLGHELTLLSFVQQQEALAQSGKDLQQFCHGALHGEWISSLHLKANAGLGLFGRLPLNVAAYQSRSMHAKAAHLVKSQTFDAVLAYRLRMAPYAQRLGLPWVLDCCDAMSWYAAQRAESAQGLQQLYWDMEERRLRSYESSLSGQPGAVLANGSADARHLQSLMGPAQAVGVLPNGVDFDYHHPDFDGPKTPFSVCFVGHLAYQPNYQAVLDFYATVWPKILAVHPEARFFVVGGGAPDSLNALRQDPSVTLTGFVEDVRPYVRQSTVALCNVRSGAGRQNKLLEALACGKPAVASSLACKGIEAKAGQHLLVADTPRAMAQAVLSLMQDPDLCQRLGLAGLAFVRQHYHWEASGRILEEALRQQVKP
jgi:glycosyltransferase involved in cell wall biosynthesis